MSAAKQRAARGKRTRPKKTLPKTPDVQRVDAQVGAIRSDLLKTLRRLNVISSAASTAAMALSDAHGSMGDEDIATTLRSYVVRRIHAEMVRIRQVIQALPEGDAP